MKNWVKVFLIGQMIIIIVVDSAAFIINRMFYDNYLKSEIASAERDLSSLLYNIDRDFNNLERDGFNPVQYMDEILDLYKNRYEDDNITNIRMYRTDSGRNTDNIYSYINQGMMFEYKYINLNGDMYICICEKSIIAGNQYLKNIFNFVIFLASAVTMLFGLITYVISAHKSEHLKKLEKAVEDVAEGKRGVVIDVEGQGFMSRLGICVNKIINNFELELQISRQFVNDMAHELKAPMNSISAYGEDILSGKYLVGNDKDALEYIVREAERMSRLSSELLSMAYLKNTDFEPEVITAEEFAKIVQEGVAVICKKKGVIFDINRIEGKIYGVKTLLTSAVVNIAENAVKACDFGEEDEEKIGIVSLKIYNRNGFSFIMIKDNGTGIPEKDIDRILEPFYRVDKVKSRKEGGVGLGLTLAMQIIRFHDGSLNIESYPGKGTEITVKLKNKEEDEFDLRQKDDARYDE